ncbi:metallophosphoesterase family protein [Thalassotalea nanhaiensis]|uniref:Metallophosphoesterase family protein n=1 Tax=Thalassotalea nanhaiensis TaxID=3065648 RepID=A0ABY9TGW5_9GAMM|nr:metallophosphoesterase family protein [Colwelliaceae bacterium SQ345]
MKQITVFLSTILLLISCSTQSTDPVETSAEIQTFQAPVADNELLRFAIIGDLTGGERQGVFNVGAESIYAMKPDFIMSIGDLIEGGTKDIVQMDKEWQAFNSKLNNRDIAFYPTVGNHDISNTTMRKWYEETIGPRYYHFVFKNALFLVLDSEDFSHDFFSELQMKRDEAIKVYKKDPNDFPYTEYAQMDQRKFGEISDRQTDYFKTVINDNKDVRWTFLFMHKPVWQDGKKKNFKKLEQALKGNNYTVFNGHVHSYKYTKRLGQDYIQIATTGGEMNARDGINMDHIMWVGLKGNTPSYLNIKLNGMADKTGKAPADGDKLCLNADGCN